MKIKSFLLNKLVFPKTILTDRAGLIESKTSKFYGQISSRRRMIFLFEDVISDLQKVTDDFSWYKIGKDITSRYMLLAGKKKIPDFLKKEAVEYIFNSFRAGGVTICEKIAYKDNSLILEGKDAIFTRKSKKGGIFAGMASGILSGISGKNIEAVWTRKGKRLKITANESIKTKYIPDIGVLDNYEKQNFRYRPNREKLHSLNDMIKFKKIEIDDSGKWYFQKRCIFPTEIGLPGIITFHLPDKIARDSIKRTTTEIIEELEIPKETTRQMLSAMGWGILYYDKDSCKLTNTFSTVYDNMFVGYSLNAMHDIVYDNKKDLSAIDKDSISNSATFYFS